MDKWIIIHPTHLLPNPFMTQPAHLPPLVKLKYNKMFSKYASEHKIRFNYI